MRYLLIVGLFVALAGASQFADVFTQVVDRHSNSTLRAATVPLPDDSGDTSGTTSVISSDVQARVNEVLQEIARKASAETNGIPTAPLQTIAGRESQAYSQNRPEQQSVRHAAPLHDEVITPGNFKYLGAFRPSELDGLASRFAYGGWGITFNPHGDSDGPQDGYPGSLFMVGHPEHQMVAEIGIPEPVISLSKSMDELPEAHVIQPFGDITNGIQSSMTNDPSQPFQLGGMQVVGQSLHWTTHRYYNVEGLDFPSHGVSSLSTTRPLTEGPWHLGPYNSGAPEWHAYKHAGYVCEIPEAAARSWFDGFNLLSGLQISTGLQTSSQGPSLFAYRLPAVNTPAGSELEAIPLLWYSQQTPLSGHHPADRWVGAEWITIGSKQAVVVVGKKSLGEFYYGDARPGDCSENKGYHGPPYEVQLLFYTHADLVAVAHGQQNAFDVQPWYRWNGSTPGGSLNQYMFPTCSKDVGGMTYDRVNQLLYIVQVDAGTTSDNEWETIPAVHVFRIIE